jgi:fibro-slime domain-containing protein
MSYWNRIAAGATLAWWAFLGCGGSPELVVPGFDGGPRVIADDAAVPNNRSDTTIIPTIPDGSGGSASDVSLLPPVDGGPLCGDGVIESGEQCDDGNTRPGDGCNGLCQIDPNYVCPTAGQMCIYSPHAVCGNGVVEAGEQCDDGTDGGGRGCSPTCQIETGYTCPADGGMCKPDAFCGDHMVQVVRGEQCDDGTNDGQHGCSAACQVVTGWKCPPTGGACAVDVYCGNGVRDTGEECDDHNRRSYDGCSSTCFVESGWTCPMGGGICSRVCGNGVIDTGETCDDADIYSGDGCSSKCQIEPNFTCSMPGKPCVFTPPPPPAKCGNGIVETGEGCDDGNAAGGDGCSAVCQIESGWRCPSANDPCVASRCGDGIVVGAEQCDDGIVDGAHGCTSTCTIVPNAVCPPGGGACIPMVCGDGKVTGTEQCDDGVNDGRHGCSQLCQMMPGWICPLAGTPCVTVCGDGVVAGTEQCDEQGEVACCTAACKLQLGFVCDPTKVPHSQPAATYCGDGVVNGPSNPGSPSHGDEQCDDGNKLPFDGCSPTCKNEPLCGTRNTYLTNPPLVSFQCFAHCGDGLVLPPEQCDDGNTQDGDGCDHTCKVEVNPTTMAPAWTCVQPPPGSSLVLPVVWRDFSPRSHPQFEVDPLEGARFAGIVQGALQPVTVGGARVFKYVPAYNLNYSSPAPVIGYPATYNVHNNQLSWMMNGPGWVQGSEGSSRRGTNAFDLVWPADGTPTLTTGNANLLLTPQGRFAQWYVDDATVNKTVSSTLTLRETAAGSGTFQYSCDDTACDSTFPRLGDAGPANPLGFFPLDGQGWVATGGETARDGGHNYSFTTEARYWFVYKGGERLSFFGDDDLWVFINGQLALDLGGIHQQLFGSFQLAANGTATVCAEDFHGQGALAPCSQVDLHLQIGSVYEIAVFHAEREIFLSDFQLTLQGFNGAPSVCTPICGDGYVVGGEQCDRGQSNVPPNTPTYGMCTTECKLGPYCGDRSRQNPPEACDNGLNIDAYVSSTPSVNMCAPGCAPPVYCGDSVVERVYGEECDEGVGNQNTYGHCHTNCKLGSRCGDGTIQVPDGEQCDDGPNNGALSSACAVDCKLKCGNGSVEAGEQCDDGSGATGNGTATSKCGANCQFKCGNGQLDQGEQCDDGKNDGSYGTCKSNCTLAPYCGDGKTDNPPEACDNGAMNSASAYGVGSCTDKCLPGGVCGDGFVNGPEKCDDGKNTGMPGSCKADCSGYVPTLQCGDGIIQSPEQCDDGGGPTGNGSATSKCDVSCRFRCGNGQIDPGEACDNGVNDGSYGTCTKECKLAGYCGDGIKNGPEQCDNKDQNQPVNTAYGVGICTSACTFAPFCGDGRIQSQFEQCEGNDRCAMCKFQIVN